MAPSTLVAGETLVDFIPDRPGRLAAVESFSRRAGGAPANVAVGLARLGAPPWFWTRVGDDPFGQFLAETLAANGVPDRFLERDPDARTALAFVAHDEAGGPDFSFYREGTADTRLEPGAVPDDALRAVEFLYLGGVSLSAEPARTALFDLAERGRAAGCTVVFDPNARPELWTDFEFGATVRELLPHVDVVTAAREDLLAAGLEGDSPAALADRLLDLGPHAALVTLGAAGARAFAADGAPFDGRGAAHPGYDVDAVDTTGAGDAFAAGVLWALADGRRDLDGVLAFANAVAALTTTARGATAALPDRDRVEALAGSPG